MAYKSPKQILAEAPKIPQAIKDKAIPALLTDVEQKKFLNQATSELSPLKQAFLGGIEASKKQLDLDTETLKSGLRQQAQSEQTQLAQRLSSSGFLRSGEQIGGGQQITGRLTESLSQADINRAKSLADLALQSAQFEADISTEAQRRANELGVQEMKRREYRAEIARQQIADIREERNIFLQEEMAEQEFRRNLALQYAKNVGEASAVKLPTGALEKGRAMKLPTGALEKGRAIISQLTQDPEVGGLGLERNPNTGKLEISEVQYNLLQNRLASIPEFATDPELASALIGSLISEAGIDFTIPEGAYNIPLPKGYKPQGYKPPVKSSATTKPTMSFGQAFSQQFGQPTKKYGVTKPIQLGGKPVDVRQLLGIGG